MPAKTIDEFISQYPPDIQAILQKIRTTIQKSAPGAEEAMAYGIPTFKLNGKNLVHFSAFKEHIGFELIGKITQFRVKEVTVQAKEKGKKKA